ncbi:hypothetical protein WR25_02678 [Diploscapter pachys]|uniref:Uncharacterized protein n=1 Tax=Diploscapter pachys TaxID=2018661 RepID=A0A2A2K1L1_9BILA|nr:hypothetical protein WR25_02678 [Diploscapter pachys]
MSSKRSGFRLARVAKLASDCPDSAAIALRRRPKRLRNGIISLPPMLDKPAMLATSRFDKDPNYSHKLCHHIKRRVCVAAFDLRDIWSGASRQLGELRLRQSALPTQSLEASAEQRCRWQPDVIGDDHSWHKALLSKITADGLAESSLSRRRFGHTHPADHRRPFTPVFACLSASAIRSSVCQAGAASIQLC